MARGTGLGSSIDIVKKVDSHLIETREKMERDRRLQEEKKLRQYERELQLMIEQQEEEKRPSQ